MARESVLKTADDLQKLNDADLIQQQKKMKRADQSLRAELTAIKYRLRDIEAQRDLINEELQRRGKWM